MLAPIPGAIARYSGSIATTVTIAWMLRSAAGDSRSRRPVSMMVRTHAIIKSNGNVINAPSGKALQRAPNCQASTTAKGNMANRPCGVTTVRSAMRAINSWRMPTGSVTSHSRSQSAAEISLLPSAPKKLASVSRNTSASKRIVQSPDWHPGRLLQGGARPPLATPLVDVPLEPAHGRSIDACW